MEQLRTEPWFTETANEYLSTLMQKRDKWRVFEFGSGASTVWFAKQKNVSRLVSVEHNETWHAQVSAELQKITSDVDRIQYMLEPVPYNDAIDRIPELFDLIVIDGRNRVKCIKSALRHLAKGGIIILDNSEREYYLPGIKLLSDFRKVSFFQPLPDKYGFTYPGWTTSIFISK